MNIFCSNLITMVPKWKYFIFMQIDYPKWPPQSVNTRMPISQDPLVEIDLSLCHNVSCMNLLYFLAVWDSKMAAVTKNSAEHENDNISITA